MSTLSSPHAYAVSPDGEPSESRVCDDADGLAAEPPDPPTLGDMGEKGQDVKGRGGQPNGGQPVYGLGMIGAWVYYWRTADTNGDRALGILKGFAWPAFLVYEAFSAVGRTQRHD